MKVDVNSASGEREALILLYIAAVKVAIDYKRQGNGFMAVMSKMFAESVDEMIVEQEGSG